MISGVSVAYSNINLLPILNVAPSIDPSFAVNLSQLTVIILLIHM